MRIAILRADTVQPQLAARFGEYPDMFIRLLTQVDPALHFVTYHVERGDYPTRLTGIDAWLITGSKASVFDRQPWIEQLQSFVRRLHAQGQTMIGVCFGHQLIAQALGGTTERAAAGWGVGVHSAQWHQRPDWLKAPGNTLNLLVSHQDQVTVPAPGSIVLAGSTFCPHALCQLGDTVLTLQGHPEFVPDYARALMQLRRERLGEPCYQAGIASLSQPIDSLAAGRWIIDFIVRSHRVTQRAR